MKQLASKVGAVVSVDMRAIAFLTCDYHRARVMLAASKPLPRVVTLSPEGSPSMVLQEKYEKMPRFCAHCGIMGHSHLECGTGEYKEEE